MFKKLRYRRYKRLEAKERKLSLDIDYWLHAYDGRSEEEQVEILLLLDQLFREQVILRCKIEKLSRRK